MFHIRISSLDASGAAFARHFQGQVEDDSEETLNELLGYAQMEQLGSISALRARSAEAFDSYFNLFS